MNLKTHLQSELSRVARIIGKVNMPQRISVDADGGTLEIELTALDQLACAFDRFAYRSDRLASKSIVELRKIADSLSRRLSYLLESISPVEVDNESCVVQMRSMPPDKNDDGTRYYELVVRRGELSLWRYQKASGQPRTVISAHVTREVFERLANDFAQAAT